MSSRRCDRQSEHGEPRHDRAELADLTIAISVTPILVADLLADGEPMPLYVHVIDHPRARVLVDTGMTQQHPFAAPLQPTIYSLNEQDFDLTSVDIVVNTHLHEHTRGPPQPGLPRRSYPDLLPSPKERCAASHSGSTSTSTRTSSLAWWQRPGLTRCENERTNSLPTPLGHPAEQPSVFQRRPHRTMAGATRRHRSPSRRRACPPARTDRSHRMGSLRTLSGPSPGQVGQGAGSFAHVAR